MILSRKEIELLAFIETHTKVSIKVIEESLSKGHVGALGKLINSKLVEKYKDRTKQDPKNIHGNKLPTYYRAIKED